MWVSISSAKNCTSFAKMQSADKVQMHSASFPSSQACWYFTSVAHLKLPWALRLTWSCAHRCTRARCAHADVTSQETEPKFQEGRSERQGSQAVERGEAGQQVIYIALCPCFIHRNKQKLCHHRQHAWYKVMTDPREWLESFTNLPLPSSSFHMRIINKETNASPRGTGASCWYHLRLVSWCHGGKVHIALALWGMKIVMRLMLMIQWQDDNFALCLF